LNRSHARLARVTLANDPTTRAPSLPVRPAVTSHSPIASFFRVAFHYPCDRSVAWPDDAGLPSFVARRRSWGFKSVPFAGFIPRAGGLSRRCSRLASEAAKRRRVLRRDLFSADGISAGPGPRAVGRLSSAPIYFRRGDRPPVEKIQICKSDRPGMSTRFDFWASLPSAVCRRSTRRPRRRSCLGLCLSQGCRSRAAFHNDRRATGRARPRFRITSFRTSSRPIHSPRRGPIRSWDFRPLAMRPMLSGSARRRSLQRIDGADACST